jgi:hypothetical protein
MRSGAGDTRNGAWWAMKQLKQLIEHFPCGLCGNGSMNGRGLRGEAQGMAREMGQEFRRAALTRRGGAFGLPARVGFVS